MRTMLCVIGCLLTLTTSSCSSPNFKGLEPDPEQKDAERLSPRSEIAKRLGEGHKVLECYYSNSTSGYREIDRTYRKLPGIVSRPYRNLGPQDVRATMSYWRMTQSIRRERLRGQTCLVMERSEYQRLHRELARLNQQAIRQGE